MDNEGNREGIPSPEGILEHLGEKQDETSIFPVQTKDIYFFAYDLLMDHTVASRYTKNLLYFKVVKLVNHRLSWPFFYPPADSALPSILRTNEPGNHVWGIIYIANRTEFSDLEHYLRVPTRSYRKNIRVEDQGGRGYHAFTYALTARTDEDLKPTADYIAQLTAAAEERQLPAEWINSLTSLGTE